MASPQVMALLRKRREKWVDLEDGRRVKFLRPSETEQGKMLKFEGEKASWNVGLEQVRECVVDWEGFTEANILGADIGSDTVVPFDKELFGEIVGDDVAWVRKVAEAILTAVVDYITSKEQTAKNFEAASTSPPA